MLKKMCPNFLTGKVSVFYLNTILNSIKHLEILNKKFVYLKFVHYLCFVQLY